MEKRGRGVERSWRREVVSLEAGGHGVGRSGRREVVAPEAGGCGKGRSGRRKVMDRGDFRGWCLWRRKFMEKKGGEVGCHGRSSEAGVCGGRGP